MIFDYVKLSLEWRTKQYLVPDIFYITRDLHKTIP